MEPFDPYSFINNYQRLYQLYVEDVNSTNQTRPSAFRQVKREPSASSPPIPCISNLSLGQSQSDDQVFGQDEQNCALDLSNKAAR